MERVKMKKVAFPFRHHKTLVCEEAKQMLRDAGFELVCNDTGEKLSPEKQHELIKDAFAVIAGTEQYDKKMLEGCNELKAIIRFGVGTDNFDLKVMKEQGIQVGVIANHNAVAEFALTLILSVMKNVPRYDVEVRNGGWGRFPMRELSRKTVGIVGFGRIGKRLAELLKGFDVKILCYDPFVRPEDANVYQAELVSLEELLSCSDVVSLHLPANENTYHMMNRESLAIMKEGAYLINTARGALVDEKALLEALNNKKLAGAALDVYEYEPVKAGNPLFALENVTLAPHVSALTYETNYNAGIICAESIINVQNGGRPTYALYL